MNSIKHLLCVATTLLLVACGTSPQHQHYVLSSNQQAAATGHAPSVGVGPITIPEYLNRNAMVYSEGGNRLHVASYERWAEPLPAGIQRVLGLNLSTGLNTQDIRPHPWRRDDLPDFAVQVSILALDASSSSAELVAEWRVTRRDSDVLLAQRISRWSTPVQGPDWQASATAAAYSTLLEKLSEEIANVIRSAADAGDAAQN
ncbi:MAG: PqiC family protein [Haliea sp.]|jgi:uncharacterized protein|nr:PqiC family protein [Haliea sp.]MDP4788744.1 PqiC family protein [Haliea sp.]MDP4917987.1 PqiC family protein [Haliea sp.]MDP5063944.1 PqiC family protein [Haliea sp.]